MTGERAAGSPAARLVAQAISEAQALDEHRRRLAADNPELGDLLLGFEEDAFRHLHDQVRDSLAGPTFVTAPPDVPGIRDRLRHGLGRLAPRRKQRGHRRGQAKMPPVVPGVVVSDESAADRAGAATTNPEDPKEPS